MGPAAREPRPDTLPRSLMKILPEVEPRLYGQSETKRGGTGTAAKLTPDPRTTHSPKAIVQGVCKW